MGGLKKHFELAKIENLKVLVYKKDVWFDLFPWLNETYDNFSGVLKPVLEVETNVKNHCSYY